jgi:cytochrome c
MEAMAVRQAVALASACACLFACGSASADEELFKRSNCMACHTLDQKRVGPPLKEVAARYSGDSGAAERLARKIREGGGGVWGELPMPPQPQVSEADAKKLAEYVLSVK